MDYLSTIIFHYWIVVFGKSADYGSHGTSGGFSLSVPLDYDSSVWTWHSVNFCCMFRWQIPIITVHRRCAACDSFSRFLLKKRSMFSRLTIQPRWWYLKGCWQLSVDLVCRWMVDMCTVATTFTVGTRRCFYQEDYYWFGKDRCAKVTSMHPL